MRLPDFEYVAPQSLKEVCLFLKDHGPESKLMGGGTDLLPSMKQGIFKPKYLVHLGAISKLGQIKFHAKSGLHIGAMVKLHSLEKNPVILERYPMIGEAANQIGSVQLRQMGTIGGNLSLDTRCYYYNQSRFWRSCRPRCLKMGGETCNAVAGGKRCFAVFSGDLAPALIALGAKVRLLSSSGERTLPLSEIYTGNGATPLALEPGEVMVSVEVPPIPKEAFTSYLKYRLRRSIDFPLANAATLLVMDREICREAKVVIGAVGSKPQEVKGIGELLRGKKVEDSLIQEASELAFKESKPISNAASSPAYRKKMIKLLVQLALTKGVKGSS